MKIVKRLLSITKSTFAVIGLCTVAPIAYQIYVTKKELSEENKKKKNGILMLPFHRMRIVEQTKLSLEKRIENKMKFLKNGEQIITIDLRTLVEIIQKAAEDPDIVSLYGNFELSQAGEMLGFAQIEEIRNAIRVFNESHRVHLEPNVHHRSDFVVPKEKPRKRSYAFAHTFDHSDSGNQNYYLASAFSSVLMQQTGNLNLFGLSITQPFLKMFLEKYGIKVDVFKHGKYKNISNNLTESKFIPEHLENTKSLMCSLNDIVFSGISASRPPFSASYWPAIINYGTLTAPNAKEVGLIDFHPSVNPISKLEKSNMKPSSKYTKSFLSKYGREEEEKAAHGTDDGVMDGLEADHVVSLEEYSVKFLKKMKSEQSKFRGMMLKHKLCWRLSEYGLPREILKYFDISAPNFNIPKGEYRKALQKSCEIIALIYIDGKMDHQQAKEVVNSIRAIRYNPFVKSVVLRVNSPGGYADAAEQILSECKHLNMPVICSMGNYAASGGYYVATNAKKIFAQSSTITGSIGVCSVKFDLTDFASSYGIKFETIGTGSHSGMTDPFQPLTDEAKNNFWRNADNIYEVFKGHVSEGRNMSMEEVEAVAQGRVWTGEQAKEIGLVDSIGGLDKAISYAQRNFTLSGEAQVVQLSQKDIFSKFPWNLLGKVVGDDGIRSLFESGSNSRLDSSPTSLMEKILYFGKNEQYGKRTWPKSGSFSDAMLIMDEDDAMRMMLEDFFQESN